MNRIRRQLLVVVAALTLASIHSVFVHVYTPWAVARASEDYEFFPVERDGVWVLPDPPDSEDSYAYFMIRSIARVSAPLIFVPGVGELLPEYSHHGPPYSPKGHVVWAVFWLANVVVWWGILSAMVWGSRRLRRRV